MATEEGLGEGGAASGGEEKFDLSSAIDDIAVGMDLEVPGREAEQKGEGEGGETGAAPAKPATEGEGTPPPTKDGDGAGAAAPPANAAPAPGSAQAPETWSAGAKAQWATVPPDIQAEILRREGEMTAGLQQYVPRARIGDAFAKMVEPFADTYVRNGIAAVQLVPALLQTHAMLTWGTPEQKVAIFQQLAHDIGIDPTKMMGENPTQAVNPLLPQIQGLQQQIATLMNSQQGVASALYQNRVGEAEREITAFMSDTAAHPYFNELIDDIRQLFDRGVVKNLPEAYEKAVYLNPVVRAKEIDRLASAAADKKAKERSDHANKARRAVAANVRSSEQGGAAPAKLGTIDDTLEKALANIKARE